MKSALERDLSPSNSLTILFKKAVRVASLFTHQCGSFKTLLYTIQLMIWEEVFFMVACQFGRKYHGRLSHRTDGDNVQNNDVI